MCHSDGSAERIVSEWPKIRAVSGIPLSQLPATTATDLMNRISILAARLPVSILPSPFLEAAGYCPSGAKSEQGYPQPRGQIELGPKLSSAVNSWMPLQWNPMSMIGVLIAILLIPCVGLAETAAEAFANLNRLVGEWEAKTVRGSVIHVTFRAIAEDSALVETFTTASGRETLTIYHADGPNLIATHHCAQGNQPRLHLDPASTKTALEFTFYDATNLAGPGASHLTRLRFQLGDADHFDKTEVYTEHGKEERHWPTSLVPTGFCG